VEDPLGTDPPRLPVSINVGTGKWTGVSTNNRDVCLNLGISAGLLPIDISGPVQRTPAP
jgi:hypothetical protein